MSGIARRRLFTVTLAVAALACDERREPVQPVTSPTPPQLRAGAFTLRDLALATAVDARLAKLSLAAMDVETALGAVAVPQRRRARDLLAPLDVARAEVDQTVAAVTHPADRIPASRAAAVARTYAERLAGAATGSVSRAELLGVRDELAAAIGAYRQSRAAWRLDAPEPAGVEREFAEARREMERAEGALGPRQRVAPREEGHELGPPPRLAGQMAVRRGRSAAERLPHALRGSGVRFVAAQEKVLDAVAALAGAADEDKPRAARAYHAAKVEALSALADYFAALAVR
jgi:hypothetical protein